MTTQEESKTLTKHKLKAQIYKYDLNGRFARESLCGQVQKFKNI